jgi:hypothetical protein
MDKLASSDKSLVPLELDNSVLDMRSIDIEFIDRLNQDVPDRHDDIQIENFIIQQNAHGCLWGVLRQTSLELRARLDTWHTVRSEYLLAVHDLNAAPGILARLRGLFASPRKRMEKQFEREALVRKTKALRSRMLNLRYEMSLFLEIARKARAKAGDLRNASYLRQIQVEFWANKIQDQMDACVQPNGVPSGLYDVIKNLPDDVRKKMGPAQRKSITEKA